MQAHTFATYPHMKHSGVEWIGDIPEHWEVMKLKRIFREQKKRSNPNLNCGSISFGKVVVKDDEKIPESTKKSYQVVQKGDFLVNPLNLNYDLISLRIALSEIDVVVSSGYIVITNFDKIDKNYYKYFLHRFDVAFMKLLGSGVRQTLNFGDIANCNIILPPLTEQTAIANYLDTKLALIDKAIAQKQRMIELLQERKQILIQQAVTRGLDPLAKMKDSGVEWIGEVPEDWEVRRLRFVGVTQNGLSKPGDFFGKGTQFLTYGDVYRDIELPINLSGLALATDEDKRAFSVLEGDVFFTRTSETVEEIGFSSTALRDYEEATFAGFLIRFRPNGQIFKGFSKYYFSSKLLRAFFVGEMNLVIRASLSQELLKNLPIVLPPVPEQIAIAKLLDKVSENHLVMSEKLTKTIEALKTYKTTLINSAVTGKIKVV